MSETKCGATPDPKIWKDYFTEFRCDREPHAEDEPHFYAAKGGHYWSGGTMGVEKSYVLEKIAERKRLRNTPEEKFKRAMEGRW